jgi:hypothetical protein
MKALTPDTNLGALADAIIKSCAVIPAARHAAVVALLDELRHNDALEQKKQEALASSVPPRSGRGQEHAVKGPASTAEMRARASVQSESVSKEPDAEDADSGDEKGVDMDHVDDYMEKLYEDDMAVKVDGAKKLLALAKQPMLLPSFVNNATLIGALTRVLREDWKKNMDLVLVLLQIFFCMSHFTQMHAMLSNGRIGDLSMRIVELEHRRNTARMLDLERLAALATIQSRNDITAEAAFRSADAEARDREEHAAEAATQATAAKAVAASEKAERTARGRRGHSNLSTQEVDERQDEDEDGDEQTTAPGKVSEAEAAKRIKLKPLPVGKVDIDKERRKIKVLSRKQEALIFVCLSLLMNLAADVAVERKMCKRNITGLLVPLLDRDNVPLLLLVTAFLRKLSIFEENKDAMAALGIAQKLVAILPDPSLVNSITNSGEVQLHQSTLRLAFNLTFDKDMRSDFMKSCMLPKLTGLLKSPAFRAASLKMLYHLSQDYSARTAFASTECIGFVMRIVLNIPQASLPPELSGLLLNLSIHPACATQMCKGDGPRALMQRLLKTNDVFILKALRNLSQYTYAMQADECIKAAAAEEELWRKQLEEEHKKSLEESKEEAKHEEMHSAVLPVPRSLPVPDEPIEYDYPLEGVWTSVVRDMLHFLVRSQKLPEFLVDTLGALANMTPRDLPESMSFATLIEDSEIVSLLERCLTTAVDDDIILEAVQLVSSIALDPDAATALAESKIPFLLGNLLSEKVADTDIVLQVSTCALRMLHRPELAETITTRTKIPLRLVELLSHVQQELVSEVDECVSIMIVSTHCHGVLVTCGNVHLVACRSSIEHMEPLAYGSSLCLGVFSYTTVNGWQMQQQVCRLTHATPEIGLVRWRCPRNLS